MNGSVITTTNVACGLYTEQGTKLVDTGSVAMTPASGAQYGTVTATMLSPGVYYLAWACDNTTTRASSSAVVAADGELMGLQQQQLGSLVLPAQMTEAAYAGQGLPCCGITRVSSGF